MRGRRLGTIALSTCAGFLLLLAADVALRRCFHLPTRFFEFVAEPRTPYAPHAEIAMRWGPIPYVVRANNAGYRGDADIAPAPAPGMTRIVAIGDSITNGFFVDNADSYPAHLQHYLRAHGRRVEVVNAARGGATITGEFDALRNGAMDLKPAIVVLTFVTNDIAELMEAPPARAAPGPMRRLEGLLLSRTAVGEAVGRAAFDLRLWWRRRRPQAPLGSDRYAIPGGDRIAENLALFASTDADGSDSVILVERFSRDVDRAMQVYLDELHRLHTYVSQHDARLVLAYLPAYSQIYGSAPMTARDRLSAACASEGIAFVDLTPAMREAGRRGVLHLAPVDFHLNPTGYRVMAEAIGAALLVGR